MQDAQIMNPAPYFNGGRIRIYFANQVSVCPPTFVLFVNNQKLIQNSYKRYLEKRLREAFGFSGVTIRLSFREKMQK